MSPRATHFAFILIALVWAGIVARAYLARKDASDFVITVSQGEVQEFARDQLIALQAASFAGDIELCGIVFERSDGTLGASPPREGDEASCGIAYFDEPGMRPVASFHTHGSFNRRYDSEVPSILDLQSDAASGMDGYVATPGGRFWRVDATGPTAILICGAGCLPQDPNYVPCPADAPQQRYTYAALVARQTGSGPAC
ncbi:MAG: DUF4329 domain-containing protein [Erythrobacter sp.]|uniref:DUF4329 domain-containing protein n=1 Tax=Erythrobacter sp. TaxID=1042 RepID=UPI002622C145|nr:DUF4329 domain-containing protein [Erythrobacter sp.]MDJ0977490.1 DUF4329 domain-containing protein [Erythrobacter sp.]